MTTIDTTPPETTVADTRLASIRGQITGRGRGGIGNRIFNFISVIWLLFVVVCALFPSLLSSNDPQTLQPQRVLQAPGGTLLGTDQYGRSVLTLLIYGARTAVIIGVVSMLIALLIGSAIGLIAGYLGGVVDMLIGRLLDILMSFPGILMALIITAALGPTTRNLIIAVGISTIPQFARVMRAQTIAVRGRLYVEAARASGYSQRRIILAHIVPNAIAPIVVLATLTVGIAIVLAASLSFLGLGPKSIVPDWGQLLSVGQPYLSTAWWISTFAGLMITLTVIATSILGDSLSDRLERGRS